MNIAGLPERRKILDRRFFDAELPLGISERRIHAERRNLIVKPETPDEWAAACSSYYFHHHAPLAQQTLERRRTERRVYECGPPTGCAERRTVAERRLPNVSTIPFAEWAEEMSNYYFHFNR
jgi:hypothetical protein